MASSSLLENILTSSNATSPTSSLSPLPLSSSPAPPSVTIGYAPEPTVTENTPLPPSPSPVASEEITVEDDDDDNSDIFADDTMGQVMDLLNFTVVPKRPSASSAYSTQLPPEDLIPKSRYISERKYMCDWVKKLRSELVAVQVDKLNLTLQSEKTEGQMQKLVKVIAELHGLYGELIKSLVVLMAKRDDSKSEVVVTIGPFDNGEEADMLINMLTTLSILFQNEFEGLGRTKEVLREVNGLLVKKGRNVPTSQDGVEMEEQPLLMEAQLNLNISSEESGSEPPVITLEEEISVQMGNPISTTSILFDSGGVDHGTEGNATSLETTINLSEFPTQFISSSPIPHSTSATITTNSITTPVLFPTAAGEDSSTAFIPVPDPQANGSTFYTLVEYPKQPTLAGKKHGLDIAKSKKPGGTVLYCECGQMFATVALLKYHIRYYTAKWKFLCKLCNRRYPGINFLKLHMIRSHQIVYGGMNACNYCTKSFQTARELLRHLKNEHNKRLPDDVDPDKASPGPTATDSTSTSSPGPSSRSSADPKSILVVNGSRCACGMELGTKEALIAHIRSEVEEHGQSFTCSMCDDTFNHPCNLKSHFREKHGLAYQDFQDRQYGCANCDEMFGSYEHLEAHSVYSHQMQVDEGETCIETDLEKNSTGINESSESIDFESNASTFHLDTSSFDDGAGTSFPVDTEVPLLITIDD